MSHQLKINTIHCIRVEENIGVDHCKLVISVDGESEPDIKISLISGQTKQLDNTYNFSDNVTMMLWDGEVFDPAEARVVGVGPHPRIDQSVWFYKGSPQSIWRVTTTAYTGDGYAYLLTYDITENT